MRQFILSALAISLLISACNNNKKPGDITIKDKDGNGEVTVNVNNMAQAADAMKAKAEELQKLTPLSLDQLKALIPATLMGAEKKSFSANSMMGVSTAEARYEINDTSSIKLNIFDCAGNAGAGIYNMQFLAMMNFQQEDENGYTKTIDFMGGKAVEKASNHNENTELHYLSGDRFLVTLEGNNVSVDALKDAAKSLNIKAN
ncbi:MAG: hypothetical protein JSU05_03095 [Bacteroidetes bacterium]|nr:hypothetical protein [Bacteroidota bacterium]